MSIFVVAVQSKQEENKNAKWKMANWKSDYGYFA